jgi:hypothetical protein
MRRIDLVAATMQGWSRLDPAQRDQFFESFISAALRLDRVAMRDWLRKRLRSRPLAAPVDLTRYLFADADIALILRATCETPGEAAGPDRDKAGGGGHPHVLTTRISATSE